jgi:predicted dehydrogenase
MVNWGIVGLGRMSYKFINAIKELENTKLLGIASLTKKKSKELIKESGIEESFFFNNYNDLINSPNIDAIYIATLNNSHFEIIKECIKAQKKILCEKPMTLNYNEAKNIFELINKNKATFLEAFVYRSHGQSQTISNIIKSGEIGEIYKVESTFGYSVRKTDPNSRLFNKSFGGGAILDVGCYTTSFCLMIAKIIGEQSLSGIKVKNISGFIGKTGVDEYAKADLVFSKNLIMTIRTSLRENLKNDCIIYGSKGKIILPWPWIPVQKSIIDIYTGDRHYKQFVNSKYTAYAEQINFFNKKYFNSEDNVQDTFMSNEESLVNMKILDTWRNGF